MFIYFYPYESKNIFHVYDVYSVPPFIKKGTMDGYKWHYSHGGDSIESAGFNSIFGNHSGICNGLLNYWFCWWQEQVQDPADSSAGSLHPEWLQRGPLSDILPAKNSFATVSI